MDVGCHAIDILEYILGEPFDETTRGDAAARGRFPEVDPGSKVEDVVTLSAQTPSGCLIAMSWNFCSSPVEYDLFTICGTNGRYKPTHSLAIKFAKCPLHV
jgi:predicted dehydrogenase